MPYNVLIVDDEPLAREGLRSMYDWDFNGFHVVGEASDGRRALKALETAQVDIIITDIAMPVMDGLELSRETKKQYPRTKILLLSCHNEFDYAREAIRLGASDYLLKAAFEADDLHRALVSIRNQLSKEARADGEKVLLASLNGFHDEDSVRGLLSHIEKYVVGVCVPELNSLSASDVNERLIQSFYLNVPFGFAVRFDRGQLVLLFPVAQEELPWESAIRLHQSWTDENMAVTFGLSPLYTKADELHSAYREASSAISRSFFGGIGGVYCGAEQRALSKKDYEKFQERKLSLKKSITDQFTEKAYEQLVKMISAWNDAWLREDIMNQAKELVHVFLASMDTPTELSVELSAVDACQDIETLKAFLFHRLERVCPPAPQMEDYHSKMITKAVEYIRHRFTDDISLADVADHVSISRNYFSEQFKKHTGHTFIEFITMTRMNEAKTLLQDGQCKIYEVAQRCGFNDVKHFSKQFRKYFGMSPSDYQGK
jgi:two-component system response regulator YesN